MPTLSATAGQAYGGACRLESQAGQADCFLCTGEGATNVIPDTVEIGGSLRGLSEQHFFYLIDRATEVNTAIFITKTALGLTAFP